jgi:hypothetical protein
MHCKTWRLLTAATFFFALPLISSADPLLGQVDTFEGGPEGWHTGGPMVPVSPIPTVTGGGPAGAGDDYLLLSSTGNQGPGGRLVGINVTQWAGNYFTNGVNAITMNLNNLGQTDLVIRLLLAAPPFGMFGPENLAITDGVELSAQGGWTTHTFSIRPSDLTVLAGTANATLAGAFELRIFHNPDPEFPGPPSGIPRINAQLGVDNVRAAVIPEPSTVYLVFAGLTAIAIKGRKAGGRVH